MWSTGWEWGGGAHRKHDEVEADVTDSERWVGQQSPLNGREVKVFDDAKVATSLTAIARMTRQGPRLDNLEGAAKRAKK